MREEGSSLPVHTFIPTATCGSPCYLQATVCFRDVPLQWGLKGVGGTENGLETQGLGWLQRFPGRMAGKVKGKEHAAVWSPSSPSINAGRILGYW